MEYVERNLLSLITEYRINGTRIDEDNLKTVIFKLISSFALMEN